MRDETARVVSEHMAQAAPEERERFARRFLAGRGRTRTRPPRLVPPLVVTSSRVLSVLVAYAQWPEHPTTFDARYNYMVVPVLVLTAWFPNVAQVISDRARPWPVLAVAWLALVSPWLMEAVVAWPGR